MSGKSPFEAEIRVLSLISQNVLLGCTDALTKVLVLG